MKKLMIAAAIVCAAAFAQAASFTWTASGVKGYGVDTFYSGSATIIFEAMTGGVVATYDGTMSGGAINTVIGDDKLQANVNYKAHYTMTDEKGNVFTSGTVMGRGQTQSSPTLGFMSGGTWAVPEPTSGLLLLLGVAGLALKRKRA